MKAIYGSESGKKYVKGGFYEGLGGQGSNLFVERDPAIHSRMRKLGAYGFSDKSIRVQEPVIQGHVDTFVHKVGELGSASQGVDIVKWIGCLSFDIIGDLAMGNSFNCLKTGKGLFSISTAV